jgi:hypothetical protein
MQITISVKRTHNKEVEQELWQKINRGMDDLADYIFGRSQEMVPVNEGMLKKSGHVEREYLRKLIIYDALYATFVEFGTRPHHLPVKAINEDLTRWCRLVLNLSEKEANAAAWAIAKKIAQYGTEAQPYLRPAADEGKAKAEGIIRNAMRR